MTVFPFPLSDAPAWRQHLQEQIRSVTDAVFEELALAVFRYQATHNQVYKEYITHLGVQPDQIGALVQVPFMPIGFFKTQTIVTGQATPAVTFASSGTTEAQQTSRHLVSDVGLYDAVSRRIFERVYGPLENVHILALLPSYLERNNSSLVYMVQRFMAHTRDAHSNFYLNNLDELTAKLRQLTEWADEQESTRKILLIGVTFGLLDWTESGQDLTFLGRHPRLIVMETGGMKGRRKELLREEVHAILMQRLGVSVIHSEYGMTELLSQAYSPGGGIFYPGPTMRVFLRDINDPFAIFPPDSTRTGGINVVDLANLDSCAFVETQDLGQYEVGPTPAGLPNAFRVIGRFDNSDVRGCNLMVP